MVSTRTGWERERENREIYLPSCCSIHKLQTLLYPLSTVLFCLSLFCVPLSLFVENVCWVWKDPREGRRREVGGWLKGNNIKPTYSPPFPTSPPFLPSSSSLSLAFLPRSGALRDRRCPNTLRPFSPLPRHPLAGQKNNLSPSSLVSPLVPSLPQCAGKRRREKLPRIEKGNERFVLFIRGMCSDFIVCSVS